MSAKSVLAYAAVTVTCTGLAFWAGCGSEPTDEELASGDGGTGSSGTASGSSSGSSANNTNADGGIDPPDAGPGGDTTKITCGTTTCGIPGETCCVSEVSGPGDRAFGCIATTDAGCPRPDGGGDVASLLCSGAANCAAGTVCCMGHENGRTFSECKASCSNGEAQLCDKTAADGQSGCPASDPCSSNDISDWGLPRTYATCGGQGR